MWLKATPWNALTETGCKLKAGPALHQAPSYERMREQQSGCILNLGTLPIYLWGNSPVFIEQEDEMPQNSSGRFGEDRKTSGINHQRLSSNLQPSHCTNWAKKIQWEGTVLCHLAQCRVQWQACEHGNIPSHSIKGVECFDCWSNYSTSFRSNLLHVVNKNIQTVNSSVQFQLLLNFQKFFTCTFSSKIKHQWRWKAVWTGHL